MAAPARPIGRTFVYGSVAFVRALRNVAGWGEQIAWTKDALCAAKWRDAYAERYIGSGGRALPTSDVAGALPAAVRPLYGDKAFPGGILIALQRGLIQRRPERLGLRLSCRLNER